MVFLKSTVDFPTEVHKRIHITALNQTPIEVSLADTGGADSALVESCRAYYDFIMFMLSDMYENPLEYGLKAGELESFLEGKKVNGMKQKYPSKTKALLSSTYNSVTNIKFFQCLGEAGTAFEDKMTVAFSDYTNIKKLFDRNLSPKSKLITNEIPYEIRLKSLERIGFAIRENEDGAVITSEKYPNMFIALTKLANSIKRIKTFGEHNFQNCDFRQIFLNYKPGYEDVVQPLDDEKRKVINELDLFLRDKKLIHSCTTFWKINYHYKGEHVFWFETRGNEFEVRITGVYGWDDHSIMNDILSAQSREFQEYALRHLNYCTACSTSHLGGFVTVLGKRKRVCGGGGIGFRVKSPSSKDIENIKKFIAIRINIIDSKSEK
jgi:hypothetical protein